MNFIKNYEEFKQKENAFVIKTERVANIKPTEKGKYCNFFIRIFLDIDLHTNKNNIFNLSDISIVKYQLHPSYKNRIRFSTDINNKFDIKVWAYGYYPIQAIIFLKLGGKITINGNVEFNVTDTEKENYRKLQNA